MAQPSLSTNLGSNTTHGLSLGERPAMPPEVVTFAEEVGVSRYLPDVLAMTQRIYAGLPLAVRLVEDAEAGGDRQVVVEVDVTAWTEEQTAEAQRQWSKELFDHCPSTHTYYFCHVPWVQG